MINSTVVSAFLDALSKGPMHNSFCCLLFCAFVNLKFRHETEWCDLTLDWRGNLSDISVCGHKGKH